MKKYILFLIINVSLSLFQVNAQTKKYSPDVEEKIRMVENNLAGWVHTGTTLPFLRR
jgi:protein associated with RNAse G/E